MVLLQVLFFALIMPYLSQAGNRCGATWDEANNNCGNTACPNGLDSECPSGQQCKGGLTNACGSTSTDTKPNTADSSKTRTLTLKDIQSFMGRPDGNDLSSWVDPINQALSRYGLNTPLRIIGFMSEVRHETASMTIFYQSLDNGGGLVHMVPSNWQAACLAVPEISKAFDDRYGGCNNCNCIASKDQVDVAKNIFGQPIVAAMSTGWWFDQGAQDAFKWKGCTEKLGFYADQGKGAAGSADCQHTGNYQLCCCIFWTINEASGSGLAQRNKYYDEAVAYAKSAWGFSAETAEEISQPRASPAINAGIAIGCVVGVVAIVALIVAIYVRRSQRLQSEVV